MLKRATSCLRIFSLSFSSSSFGVRVNLLHCYSFTDYYWLLVFFYLYSFIVNYYLQISISFHQGNLYLVQIAQNTVIEFLKTRYIVV